MVKVGCVRCRKEDRVMNAIHAAYLVCELIGHDSPVANHVSCDPGALVSTIYPRLNNVLKSVVKMVQNITNTLNFVPKKLSQTKLLE